MTLFNRILIIIVLAALLIASFLALVTPVKSLSAVRGWLDQLDETVPFRDLRSGAYWAYLGALVGIIALCGALLWLELRATRRTTVLIPDSEGRRVEVTVKSITQRLRSEVGSVADVSRVRPTVISHGKKVDVNLALQVHPAVELGMKSEEVIQLAREVVQDGMGVTVGHIRVDVQERPEAAPKVAEPQARDAARIVKPETVEAGHGTAVQPPAEQTLPAEDSPATTVLE